MATASTAMERRVNPLEFGPREGAVHYARRTVATPVGRWLVVLGASFLAAAAVLLLADLIRTEILEERE